MNFTLSYNDDKNTKRSINPKDICKSTKNFFEKTNTREDISKTTMSEVLIKKKKKKIRSNHYEVTISEQEVTKLVSSQTNNKSSNNDNLTLESYKHFYQKIEKFLSRQSPLSSLSSRIKFLVIAVKKYTEADFKDFWSYTILLNFLTLSQIFCSGLQILFLGRAKLQYMRRAIALACLQTRLKHTHILHYKNIFRAVNSLSYVSIQKVF